MRFASKLTRAAGTFVAAAAVVSIASTGTQNAVANGDTRTLRMYHLHTKETLTITFKRNGVYDAAAMKQVSWFLRDWRKNESTGMEPRLLDIIWEVYRETGASDAVNIVCGYRSPGTNEMLRSRTRGVAKFSQHTLGRAMDFFIPGVALTSIREAGIRLQRGGVGFYPTSGSPFVHLDVGNIRAWPRMTRSQLARVFPDGRTVHLPAEGGRMPGYEVALADIQKRGATVSRAWNAAPPRGTAVADSAGPAASGKKRNFLARLLGMDEGDDADEESTSPVETGRERPASVAATRPAAVPARAAEPDAEAVPAPAPTQTAAPVKPAAVPLPIPAPLAKDEPVVTAAAVPPPPPLPQGRRTAAPLAFADAGSLPPPPMPADPAELPPQQRPGPGMVWVQGPIGTQYAPQGEPAALAEPEPQTAAEAVILPGTVVPLPRPKPATAASVQVASLSPQPISVQPVRQAAISPSAVASRIAAAYAQTAAPRTVTPGSDSVALRGNTTGGGLALASRIATANAALHAAGRPASATAGAQTAASSKLPENFTAQARQLVGERVALAYASPDLLMGGPRGRSSVLPLSLNRSIALAAPRRSVRGAALVTAKLDRKGWQEACKPQSARSEAAAETPPAADAEPQLLAAPADALPYGFGSDPSFGTKPGRFTGSPVMFIRLVSFAQTRTADSD